jgi:hypothetical protein
MRSTEETHPDEVNHHDIDMFIVLSARSIVHGSEGSPGRLLCLSMFARGI